MITSTDNPNAEDVDGQRLIETTTLTVTVQGGVGELTLTRPELLNRFDADLHGDFSRAIRTLRDTPGLRSLILSSTGKAFSAGADFELMRHFHDEPAARAAMVEEGCELNTMMMEFPVPIVAALQGDTFGLATSIVLACDVVVAARQVRLCDPHVMVGLVAGDGGCVMWPTAIGLLRARRYLLTGDPVGAEAALAMGLVTDLVETADEALPVARSIARRIADLPPLGVRGTKQALNRVLQERASEVFEFAMALNAEALASDDLLEALTALKERRRGQYVGR